MRGGNLHWVFYNRKTGIKISNDEMKHPPYPKTIQFLKDHARCQAMNTIQNLFRYKYKFEYNLECFRQVLLMKLTP